MQQQAGNPAVRQGLIYGGLIILLGVIQSGIQFVRGGTDAVLGLANSRGVPGLGAIVFVTVLALLFLAGMFTARQNGKVGSATIAGLIAGVIGDLYGILLVVIVLAVGKMPATSSRVHLTRSALIIGAIIAAFFILLLYAGIGAGMGALGGLAGRGNYQSRNPLPTYQESMYQGLQQPGAYPPPPPGGYPPPPQQPGAYPPPPQQYPPHQPQQYPPQEPQQ